VLSVTRLGSVSKADPATAECLRHFYGRIGYCGANVGHRTEVPVASNESSDRSRRVCGDALGW
jgi:hypothetical protein